MKTLGIKTRNRYPPTSYKSPAVPKPKLQNRSNPAEPALSPSNQPSQVVPAEEACQIPTAWLNTLAAI